MAQDTVTLAIRPTSATPGIGGAYAHLIERLSRLPMRPFDPRFQPDAEDLEDRAETLRCHMLAVQDYVIAVARDTANASWSVNYEPKYLDGLLRDIIADVVGPIDVAAETVRQEGTWRAA